MKRIQLLLSLLFIAFSANAQLDSVYYSVNEATLIGIGNFYVKDTYLSEYGYDGTGLNIINERMKVLRRNNRISSQKVFQFDLAFASNSAETVNAILGKVNYFWGYHYRFQPTPNLKVLTGGGANGMLSFVYNSQGGNNPASFHLDLDLAASAAAIYTFDVKNHSLALRYQFEIPMMGVLFAPDYGASYYEMFQLKNMSNVTSFSSFHNKFAMNNYLTLDFPLGNFTVRAGYLNRLYYSDIKQLQTRNVSHSFVIGFAKEFVVFAGKNLKKNRGYESAFY